MRLAGPNQAAVRTNDQGRKPRLLILAPRYPYPLVSGDRTRIHYIARELSRHFDISLLCFCDRRDEFAAPVPADAPFHRVERVWLSKGRSYSNVLRALFTKTPLQVAHYESDKFAVRARELAKEHDIVLCHLVRTARYGLELARPRMLEMTDAISLNYERARGTTSPLRLRTWVYGLEQRRLRAFEVRMLNAFDTVTLVSDIDREYLLEGRSQDSVLVCSNGVDLEAFPFEPRFDDAPVVVFFANMTTLPNLDAATHFARDVLPMLRRIRPWTFRVIGRIRPADARTLMSMPGVEITGEVSSIPEAVRGARAGVCPMRVGAGIQNKLLEYMALGLPAITSTLSFRALSARAGSEVLVADEPEQYVNHLESVFRDVDYSRRIAIAAHEYVTRCHSWRARLAPLVAEALRLCESRGHASVKGDMARC